MAFTWILWATYGDELYRRMAGGMARDLDHKQCGQNHVDEEGEEQLLNGDL